MIKSAFQVLAEKAWARVRLVDLPAATPHKQRRAAIRDLKHAAKAEKEMIEEERTAGVAEWTKPE